ncbi:MAG: 30S ribosomal protein S9 [candidate division WOR-3 bacterium]
MEEIIIATGRRKNAVATSRISPGTGKITINKKTAKEYLKLNRLVHEVRKPLERVGVQNDFDLNIVTKGGGISGQADAIRYSVAKGLVKINEEYKKPLKDAGFLTKR